MRRRGMAGSKGLQLGLIVGSLVSITVAAFLYLSSPSMSAIYSFSAFRPAHFIDEELTLLDQDQQSRYRNPEAYENGRFASGPTNRYSAVVPKENDEVAMKGERGPSLQMELTRRSIVETSREMWLFVRHNLKRLQQAHKMSALSTFNPFDKILKYTLDNLAEYHSAVNDQIKNLAECDGWNTWRREEAQKLHTIIQRRLHVLQNPKNCSTVPVLLCNLTNPHGFASGVHDVLWCFIKAYYSQKRMVLDTSSWHYAPAGWETLFRPLTDTCGNEMGAITSTGPGDNDDKARRLMALLPSDLGPRILRIHGNPLAWWYGQFILYLMRPNVRLKAILQDLKRKINFKDIIVGVHVRRTDKIGNEAQRHRLEEYMEHVEDYFAGKEMILPPPIQRRIYLATDDPHVITECRKRFPEYVCIYNSGGAVMASDIHTRYSNSSLWGVLSDVFMLANTNFLVCTFSSGLCRLAYELMQALKPGDASDRFVSLDVQYHYAWLSPPPRVAIYRHRAKSAKEMSFSEGEMLQKKNERSFLSEALKGKRNNGFAQFVKSWQREKEGLVPIFKTKENYRFIATSDFADQDSSVNSIS